METWSNKFPELVMGSSEIFQLQHLVQLSCDVPRPLQLFRVNNNLRPFFFCCLHFLDLPIFFPFFLLCKEDKQGARSFSLRTVLRASRHCLHRLLRQMSSFAPPGDGLRSDGSLPGGQKAACIQLQGLFRVFYCPLGSQAAQGVLQSSITYGALFRGLFRLGHEPVRFGSKGQHFGLSLRRQVRQAQDLLVAVGSCFEVSGVGQCIPLQAPDLG
mmetsp:Transcript_38336/g.81242  ORF Transcript_38336/g.81242 Transcript_38336/m.81242 type:complete len:214 (+) Transcript_38336:526-1167(+)